jgi:filamentous hemagglutinin
VEGGLGFGGRPTSAERLAGGGGRNTTPTRFINGAKVIPTAAENVLEGTVDLKPTLDRIASGQKFSHRNDGAIFRNDQGLLPKRSPGYYREYVHPTPGVNGPGPQRIVTSQGGELYYTPDHYQTFIPVNP